jgi:mannose-6-phosphate isomerase
VNPPAPADHRGRLILLPPNRVWRSYPGGRTLDTLAGAASPADSHLAEDWIASTTRAVNPGRETLVEGLSQVRVGLEPGTRDLAGLLASDPDYFLGAAHVRRHGAQPQLLVKFLDSGTRLHFQVHPTRAFAREVLGAPSGKTEAYYVLGTREEGSVQGELTGYIYAGFQRPPTPAQLRDYILTQDLAAIEACFDRIPVRPGDTFLIPGGTPHALGAGVFMVEIQEPSDLVVRFEFARAGHVLPEASRFMGRDLDLALRVFNLAPLGPAELARRVRCTPRLRRDLGAGSVQEELIGPDRTDCFQVRRTLLRAPVMKHEEAPVIAIVTSGTVLAEAGGETHRLETFAKFFLPAGLGPVRLTPLAGNAEILECLPPA